MTDKTDLIREIHEYVTTHGGENTATHLLVQAASAIQTQAAELEAVGAGGVQALSAAPGAVSDTKYSQFLSDVLTAAGLITHGKQCKALGERLSDMVMRLRAAPQQEAQEPALFVSPKQLAALTDPDDPEGEHGRYLPARKTSKGLFTQPLYTAPQPAPAPLSDDVVKDAARWRMVALIGNEVMLHPEKRTQAAAVKAYMDATHSGLDLTGAVDAAIAAKERQP